MVADRPGRDARPRPRPSRRHLLAGLLGLPALARPAAAAPAAPRIVALDWAAAETLAAIGAMPVAIAEKAAFAATIGDPGALAGVVDAGLRLQPNPELMHELKPDWILINPLQRGMTASLAAFGQVREFEVFGQSGTPYDTARAATLDLGQDLGRAEATRAVLAEADAVTDAARTALARLSHRSVCIIELIGSQHVLVYGATSLFQGVLDRVGLTNAWPGRTGPWGTAVAGLEALAALSDAGLVYFGAQSPDARRLRTGSFWRNLPAVRAGRTTELPPLWGFGGVPAATRMARLLGERLGPAMS